LSLWRKLVCGPLIFVLPAMLAGQDSARAILHSQEGVLLNGNPAPPSSAIFPDDLIQTQTGQVAKMDADGSTVTIQQETIVQFEGNELVLDHGGLQVSTARQMRVRANCLVIIPVTADWTEYNVTDTDGKVTVTAIKNDARIQEQGAATRRSKQGGASNELIVHQGEQKTRDEHCTPVGKPPSSVDANKAILNTIEARIAGIAVVGGVTCLALCRGDNPISPSGP